MKLVKLPQTGIVLDMDRILVLGQPDPTKPTYVAVLEGTTYAPHLSTGDYNALVQEMQRAGVVTTLETPREEVKVALAS